MRPGALPFGNLMPVSALEDLVKSPAFSIHFHKRSSRSILILPC
jgi:hypothetical protein